MLTFTLDGPILRVHTLEQAGLAQDDAPQCPERKNSEEYAMVTSVKRLARLTDDEVRERLEGLNGWEMDEGTIKRLFKTPSFPASMILANTVAQLAEAAQHHPDMKISYRKVSVKLITHSSGGLTEKDFALARQLDAVLDWQPGPPLGPGEE